MAYCRTEQFEVSPLISGLTPWGHNKKKEQMQTRCLNPQDDDDEDDKKQVEKQENVVRRQFEGDMRQDEDGKGRATDVWKKDEGEKSRELGKGGQRVNLGQQQGGRDWSEWESFSCRGPLHFESRGRDGGCEQSQEDERERLKGGIGQGKGMRKGQGKGKGEFDEQNWEESWLAS